MPWFMPIVPESIKKRVCIYLLQRYLGQFFEEKLRLDQLSIDLYNGTGTVEKVSLDVQALNELGEKQNWPMEFVDGYLEKLFIRIPWSAILKESSYIEVEGLKLTVQPKQRNESATSMFESMWSSSMTNSMQLAQECMKQDVPNSADTAQPLEAIERFAQTIESILCKVKVKFINTVIQLEHVPKNSNTGVALCINIAEMQYLDEAGDDPPVSETTDLNNQQQNKTYIVSSFTTKNFFLQGVTFSTVEFPSNARTFSRSVMTQSQTSNGGEKEKEDSLVTTFLESENVGGDDDGKKNSEDRDVLGSLDEQRHVVLFGKLSKRQEIRVRLKQSENVTGPKVSIEVNLGSLTLFLSPRQVHVLLELASGLASPDMEDTSNVAPRQKCTEKPMGSLDYQRVEQELQQQLHPLNTYQAAGLQGAHGWSTAALEESDSEENFLPMKSNSSGGMYDSSMSGISSSMESSLSSSITSSITETSSRTRRRVCNIDSDPTAEISHFQIRFASLAAVILHEDLLTLSTDQEHTLIVSSVKQMQATAESFFEKLGHFAVSGYGNKDFECAKGAFEKACNLNHLRLLAAPLQIEGNETTTLTAFSMKGELTAAKLEVLECLNQKGGGFEYVPLLSFPDLASTQTASTFIPKPSLKVNLKHVERTTKSGLAKRVSMPKTDVSIILNNSSAEIDVTIVDRICALLNPQPVCIIEKSANNPWVTSPAYGTTQSESRVDLKISSPSLTLKLRFPIPDFRPPHDMNKVPWWKRHVRPDFLTLNMTDMTAQTTYQTNQSFHKYVLQCRALLVHYCESDSSPPLPIAKTGVDEKYGSSMQDVFNHSRLTLQIHPVRKYEVELDQAHETEGDPMTQSVYGALGSQTSKQPGPFSAKRVVHESDTPHTKPQQEDSEELIIPGDKQEISDFIEMTTQSARIQIEVSLPTVTVQLVSKHTYELIYNRINNDLLLWEPSAPKPKTFDKPFYPGYGNVGGESQDLFMMCKSGIQYDSESDSDERSDAEDDGIFYSTYDRMRQSHKKPTMESRGQNYLVVTFNVGHGLLCWNPPVRDLASSVIPSQHGEFLLNVEDTSVFVVSGYQGDDNLGYVCVQAHAAQLYHCDMISTPSQSPPLKELGSTVARHLHPTVYKSEQGMLATCNNRGGDREMVTVAVKIQANHETHHVKTVRVAVGINKATLRHRMCNEPNSWITQLADFFNVTDYPIPGYHAKDVLTELHLHLWDCAVDYRPHNIALRSAVTMGNFSMSSHLSAQANTSTLRFIAEECALFISDKAPPRMGTPSSAPVDLKRDYVSVIDVGLFELSLKTNDKKSGINPHIDLRASNNVVHIRTCADSAKALTQLLTYFAGDGDLISNETSINNGSTYSSPRHQPEVELVSVEPQDVSNLSVSQHQHVNELLGEAMKDCTSSGDEGTADVRNSGAKIFFFPDENTTQDTTKPLPQVTYELGDVTFRSNKSSDTDDDFCFVGDEAGMGILPKNGLPEIRWLSEEPIRIIENHFSIPIGKTDLLKTPKDFPVPVMKYTLCDMSVVWHMYGGNDFKMTADKEEKPKKSVNFSDMKICEEVGFSNTRTGEVIFTNFMEKKKPQISWQVKGGVNRDHDVLIELQLNKVRFQHEIYPESTREASRQVLLVTDLEIRDRLASSQINKFLYQYTSQSRPKQSHANMIMIIATHIRPDSKLKSQECILKVSLLPLRLNIDQDTLLFMINFFNELCGNTSKDGDEMVPSKHTTPTHQPPVMTVSVEDDKALTEQAQKIVGENLLILLEENKNREADDGSVASPAVSNGGEECPIYFRKITFSPEVPIRLDYHGKRVDMTHGPLPGLLMGLAQLNCSELRLKRLSNRHGLLGVDKLMAYALQEWLNDIKKNQLPSLLGGIGPMHSLVQLFQGIRDLFWMPIEQYQKDGRIVRGLQRGANSFTTSTAMAALELTSRIIHLIQITAETAYDMLSPGPSVRRTPKNKGKRKRYGQPQDIREGMTNAYMVVKEGIGETAENIVRIASHEHEQKGYSGAVGGVLRQIPPTIFKPIIIASEATSNVLGGMRCQLVPDAKREANQKWKSDDS